MGNVTVFRFCDDRICAVSGYVVSCFYENHLSVGIRRGAKCNHRAAANSFALMEKKELTKKGEFDIISFNDGRRAVPPKKGKAAFRRPSKNDIIVGGCDGPSTMILTLRICGRMQVRVVEEVN